MCKTSYEFFKYGFLSIFPLNQKVTFFLTLKQMEFNSQRLSLVQKNVKLTQSDKTYSLCLNGLTHAVG